MPVVDRDPRGGEAGLLLGVAGQQVGAAVAPGQQQARLLEGLAHDGHPVGQAARGEAQQGAGLGVGPPGAQGLGLGPAVERIDRAAGEHVGPADEVRAQVAPHHEHLERAVPPDGAGRVAHQHDGGGRTDLHRGRARGRGSVAEGRPMEARRRGYRQAGGGAPGTGAPLG